ncbi:response regulator transcription factor [Clostridium beijerinckii]|jgi:Response regulators consisting of a CheY-like receiver domain and a winged-helix DNA-binding domain|uniref:Stage 0 sporulation protein A homolog n=2 Tax=Clostridium beijerinckii TaxID=1520 RepID=A0AAE2RVE1_CLOBE|nr:response regulator transcription factor [Clostridium beijerinckii]ABR35062.1 two component transcriptional regulator, winged helix family [Clostridium beijerinckii NCIMB 8052]AIU03728.1 two component transcriptional regulator [Clostridium beijerinckii ATCC 35702]MBF7810303.1 response regulator transcription factor [Clostridium beijerinckii]NOW90956.1 DNA-binding response OmpR family regulator [Clostridium beijerinckii]NRT23554.1 DNA-binding response OmpR family regulator [Clostridium beijer
MRKILIIEDDKLIAELERDYLEVSGFKTEIAFNGEDGLNFALNREFDLILLDLMLPSKDGFQLCKEIRSNKEIPILMVTAKKDSVDKIKGFNLGADDYIVKPFDPSELVARVNAHLSRYDRLTSMGKKDNINNGVMVFKRLKILKRERRVYVADKEVKLANKEFELLLFLATNSNIVFSKTILLDRIWGMDSFADVATVTVHINRIRDKIEEDSSNPQFIETVWGAGYRFKL